MRNLLLAALAVALLSGCAGKGLHEMVAGDPQANAGITTAKIEKSADGAFKGSITDGKDRGESRLDMTMPDGTMLHFESRQVDASTAQGQREAAGVETTRSAVEALKSALDLVPRAARP